MKGDERILGDGDFVESVLKVGQEQLERRYQYQTRVNNFEWRGKFPHAQRRG